MLKVAFVVQRYGVEVNGGAELLCRQVAEHMASYWEVTVLTTCAIDYLTWQNAYPPGPTTVNGIPVQRFPVDQPRDLDAFNRLSARVLAGGAGREAELQWMKAQGPFSAALLAYLQQHAQTYDRFIFFTYLYASTFFGLPCVADRSLLVPTAHDEPPIYLEIFRELFCLPQALLFLTPEEQEFVNQRFGTQHILQEVVGVGVEAPHEVRAERFRAQYAEALEECEFILYVGRVDASKGCHQLCSHFMRFREDVPTLPVKLVLLGSLAMEIPPHPDIVALGFVSEQAKADAMAAAQVVLLPSPYESLSMVALEAWHQSKAVLANGACAVLRGQCKRSNGGLWYNNYAEFQETLSLLLQEAGLRERLGASGRAFVQGNYHWRHIESKYSRLLKLTLLGTSGEEKLGSLTPEHVVWGYRLFLDREPENDQIVMDKLQCLASIQELRQEFTQCSEFRQKNPGLPTLSGHEPQMLIDDACSEHDLHMLFDHIQEAWQYFGSTEPYHSVLTSEQFLQINIQKTREAFYNTGKQDVLRLFNTLDRNGIDYSSYKSCLEYGCGLGRVTRWLAERFETVFGYDISQSHLQYAKSYFSDENVYNVSFFHIGHLKDIQSIQRVDLIYSIIVLQHNPPPIITMIIKEFIKKLNSGGIAFFQVPTYRMGYSFSIEKYLKDQTKRYEIEMHVLPQVKIFDIIRQGGGRIIEVLEDSSTGSRYKEVSNTFLLQKE